jgi:protein SCO1
VTLRAARARVFSGIVAVVLLAACASGGRGASDVPSGVQYGTKAAPFNLVDQFGQPVRLSDFHGSVVLLTFIDPKCGGICPLTADLLRRTKETVGDEPRVQLVAVDANPKATSVADVRRWSFRHGMLHEWLFLTAPVARLRRVWAGYGVRVVMKQGDVAHAAAVFLIDPNGRERGVFPIAARNGIPAEVDALTRVVREIA